MTGGACAYMVDAVGHHPKVDYVCMHHEQAAAMAADAVWRVDHQQIGVTLSTSGPGATNLITGIACSFFDSIPSLHISGQVNMLDRVMDLTGEPRQIGFQETNIVDIVRPVTKYAVRVNTVKQLKEELLKGYEIATTGRMGPVLIDVPMNVQKDEAGTQIELNESDRFEKIPPDPAYLVSLQKELDTLLNSSRRPLVLFGAGIGLAKVETTVLEWLETNDLPFVSSWNGQAYFNHNSKCYFGNIGVYGNRGANYILQNCDLLLAIGNRLDTRQRTSRWETFATGAKVIVFDIDQSELDKLGDCGYAKRKLDLRWMPTIINKLAQQKIRNEWRDYLKEMKQKYFQKEVVETPRDKRSFSPHSIIIRINEIIKNNSIVIVGIGSVTCWTYQSFKATEHTLFINGGMAPMGYGLGAAIGAALTSTDRPVVLIEGDGGFQLNIQELQTLRHHKLNVKIVIMNNSGYGIIKQFQDENFDGRYEASGRGLSMPNFELIVKGYDIDYHVVNSLSDLDPTVFSAPGPAVFDVKIDPASQIMPKAQMGDPINDQFPYVSDKEFVRANRFVSYRRSLSTGHSS